MAEDHDVKIVGWPKELANLAHSFDPEQPCPVLIRFDEAPARVEVSTSDKPLNVNMGMAVSADKPIPVCIKVCEPICARSSYRIGITIFDQPVAQIAVQGMTRLFECDEAPGVEQTCVDFKRMKTNIEMPQAFTYEDLVFIPLGDPLRTTTIGDPASQVKLTFPRTGVRVEFPQPASEISLTVNNYADPQLDFYVFAGTTLVNQFTRMVDNQVATVELSEFGVTAVEVRGGNSEASIIEICYSTGG